VPFVPAGRVLLPAVVAVLIVAACGARTVSLFLVPRSRASSSFEGLLVIAGHNALFFSPRAGRGWAWQKRECLRGAQRSVGLPLSPIGGSLPPRRFRARRSASRVSSAFRRGRAAPVCPIRPPSVRFVAAGGDLAQRLRAAGFSHVLVGLGPLNGKTTMQGRRRDIELTPAERAGARKVDANVRGARAY